MSKDIIVKTTGGTLNMRSAPSKTASIIGKLQNGTKLVAIGQEGEFYKISALGTTGYIMKEFTADVQSEKPSTITLSLGRTEAQALYEALKKVL